MRTSACAQGRQDRRQRGLRPALTQTVRRPVDAIATFTASTVAVAVIDRGVGDRQPRQPGDERLVLEEGLEDSLSHLRLIGRIGRDELAAPERPCHRRHVVVVSPPPAKQTSSLAARFRLASRDISEATSGSDIPGASSRPLASRSASRTYSKSWPGWTAPNRQASGRNRRLCAGRSEPSVCCTEFLDEW